MLIPTQGYGIDTVAGGGTISVVSVVASVNAVTITFVGANPILTGTTMLPASWVITSGSPYPTTVSAVNVVGSTVVLTTSETSASVSYHLQIPSPNILSSANGTQCIGPFSWNFNGMGVGPSIWLISTIDARTIKVQFNKEVNEWDALNETNYSVNHGLKVEKVKKIGAAIFELTTTHQIVGTSYTVTASNIRDLAGNVI